MKRILLITILLTALNTIAEPIAENEDIDTLGGALVTKACGTENLYASIFQPEVCINFTGSPMKLPVISIKSGDSHRYFLAVSFATTLDELSHQFKALEITPLIIEGKVYIEQDAEFVDEDKHHVFDYNKEKLSLKSAGLGFDMILKKVNP